MSSEGTRLIGPSIRTLTHSSGRSESTTTKLALSKSSATDRNSVLNTENVCSTTIQVGSQVCLVMSVIIRQSIPRTLSCRNVWFETSTVPLRALPDEFGHLNKGQMLYSQRGVGPQLRGSSVRFLDLAGTGRSIGFDGVANITVGILLGQLAVSVCSPVATLAIWRVAVSPSVIADSLNEAAETVISAC